MNGTVISERSAARGDAHAVSARLESHTNHTARRVLSAVLTAVGALLATVLITALTLGYSISAAMPDWLETPLGERSAAPAAVYPPIRGGYICLLGEDGTFFAPEYCTALGSVTGDIEWTDGERAALAPDELIVSADCALSGSVGCDGYAYGGESLGGESRRIVGVLNDSSCTVVLPDDEAALLISGEEIKDENGVSFTGNAVQLAVTAVSDRLSGGAGGTATVFTVVLSVASVLLLVSLIACGVITIRAHDGVSVPPDAMYYRYIAMAAAVFAATSIGTAWLCSRIEAMGYGSLVDFGLHEIMVIAAGCVITFALPCLLAPLAARLLRRMGTHRAEKKN